MAIEIRTLRASDTDILQHVAPVVFDYPVDPGLAAEFLSDLRHRLVDDGVVVGFVSGVTYIHPDKPIELWINEVAVAPSHRRQGIGKRMLEEMLTQGRLAGCHEAWVLTETTNRAAMRLYTSAGGIESSPDTVMFAFALAPEGQSRAGARAQGDDA
jgi:ribosomal protein S18 acetylase RimI-like enzyme